MVNRFREADRGIGKRSCESGQEGKKRTPSGTGRRVLGRDKKEKLRLVRKIEKNNNGGITIILQRGGRSSLGHTKEFYPQRGASGVRGEMKLGSYRRKRGLRRTDESPLREVYPTLVVETVGVLGEESLTTWEGSSGGCAE